MNKRAREHYETEIIFGDVYSMSTLATWLHIRNRVPKDSKRAKELYEQAVQKRDGDAIYKLGSMLEFVRYGVVKDAARTKQLFEQAHRRVIQVPCSTLGVRLNSERWERTRCVQTNFMNNLSRRVMLRPSSTLHVCLVTETMGLRRTRYDEKLYKQAVEMGDSDGMFNLMLLLSRGNDRVAKDVVHTK